MSDYQKGGYVPVGPQPLTVRLAEGERIVDRRGRIRAQVIKGRLVRFPLWVSWLLPRIPGR